MADMDQIWNTSDEALEQPEGILQLNDQPGYTSGEALEQSYQPTYGEALEQPEGILQLIDQPGYTSGEALEQSYQPTW